MRRPWTVLAVGLALAGCGRGGFEAEIPVLEREVQALRDSLAGTGRRPTSVLAAAGAAPDEVVIGLRTAMVMDVLSAAARVYLGEVLLHLDDPVTVSTGNDVRIDTGLFTVTAGSWDLDVTVQRIDATLRADSILLSVPDSQRLAVRLPVQVLEGGGDAVIDFRWDASRAVGVVCGDFQMREEFSGTVEPGTHVVEGYFRLEQDSAGVTAVPVVESRVSVSPRPTPAAWNRVRAILAEQDRLFNCGLAISREGMEGMLRDLLERGFRFSLPESILRPVPLPASLADVVRVAGRRAALLVEARPPRLDPDRVWVIARIRLADR